MRLLRAEAVVVVRDGRRVVDGVSVNACAGEMLAVVGPSGSGKTTLLSVLAGMIAPDRGRVTLDSEPLTGALAQRRRFGFVLQTHALLPVLTASENVEVPLRARGLGPEQARVHAAEALHRVGLVEQVHRLVERLSGGQQQRVGLARAIATSPEVLIADEPTSELDLDTRDHIVEVLEEEARRGAIVVVATHDTEVSAACDHGVHLVDGRIEGAVAAS